MLESNAVSHIERTLRHGESIHVLTEQEAEVRRIAEELSHHFGQASVAILEPDTGDIPHASILVSTPYDICFAYLRQSVLQDDGAPEDESLFGNAHAIVVKIPSEDRRAPCIVSGLSDTSSGGSRSVTFAEILKKYRSAVDLKKL